MSGSGAGRRGEAGALVAAGRRQEGRMWALEERAGGGRAEGERKDREVGHCGQEAGAPGTLGCLRRPVPLMALVGFGLKSAVSQLEPRSFPRSSLRIAQVAVLGRCQGLGNKQAPASRRPRASGAQRCRHGGSRDGGRGSQVQGRRGRWRGPGTRREGVLGGHGRKRVTTQPRRPSGGPGRS